MSSNNFNPQAKIFYRPIDAALRWCNLIRYEAQVLQAAGSSPEKLRILFPQWPCLHANTEKIYDAVRHGELPYGYLGISVPLGTPVEPTLLTVRHSDLRYWMQIHYPDQRPVFLFSSVDDTQDNISLGVYFALQAERDALLRERDALKRQLQDVEADLQALGLEQESLKTLVKTQGQLSDRSEHTYLQIIGALINTVLDVSPAGKPLSVFKSQAAIVDALTARHNDISGLSKRTLDKKFAAANRALKKTT
ncbi:MULTISPECIES: hypothetical protein [Pseudomonas]|uniref:Uncharacterized protein n=1 Tax=Pseudomonas frederiksbergensis TaxID=104087 RepID=A0A6L5C2H9_9PSED|nr:MULTISPECIES: hypothetical protein [Pseudomonas]KAA8554054.1 hypothetical protein FX984_00665 [Pseudomonas marginalis]KAF2394800.1 hypothetical protein FX983_02782 [Pseudomonas frederiksbergensis]